MSTNIFLLVSVIATRTLHVSLVFMEIGVKFENWALLVQGQTVIWQFGELDEEIRTRTILFLIGLHNIGKEIFDKGIATVRLAPEEKVKYSSIRGDELLIVNLEGSFFLIIFDPLTTIKMMSRTTIPEEIDLLIRGVLSGQASITYATFWSNATPEAGMHVDMFFKTALDEVVSNQNQQDLNIFAGGGTCSFTGLTTIQGLVFHVLLRRFFEIEYLNLLSQSWAIIQQDSSLPVYLEHQPPKDAHLLSGYFTVINEYIMDIFKAKPIAMVFGGGELTSIDIVHGQKHFMSISNPIELFRDPEFLHKFKNLEDNVKNDLKAALNEYLAKNLADIYLQQLRQKHLDVLVWMLGNPEY